MVHSIYTNPSKVFKEKVPVRLLVALMLFTGAWMSYMMRVNMSINIIAMVRTPSSQGGHHKPECVLKAELEASSGMSFINQTTEVEQDVVHSHADYGERYSWSSSMQGMVLGCYFWGYTFTSLPGGLLSDYFGGTRVVGITTLLSGILTALCPLAASMHVGVLIAVRFLLGFLAGALYPALHNLVSRWAPPDEKGKFVAALLGGTFGTVVTWAFTGYLIETYGWVWAFYVPAIIGIAWSGVWFLLVTDSPATHKFITLEEAQYITKSLGDNISNEKKITPFLQLARSIPFWSLLILHFGSLWGLYFLLTSAPKFLTEVLGFNLKNAGFLSGLPYLARMLMGLVFGSIGDFLRKKQYLSVTAIRKIFCLFSHIIPGLFLFGLAYVGCSPMLSVAIITLSLGFNGASTMTNLQNSQDLAPNFAGTLYGIINCLGSTTGFISPSLVGYFVRDHSGLDEWGKVFLVGGSIYIIVALWFLVFGSGEVQPWNEISHEQPKQKQEEPTNVVTQT